MSRQSRCYIQETKPFLRDPVLEVLIERGRQHEAGYLSHLQSTGLQITLIDGVGIDVAAVANTLAAMKAGVPAIAQAALRERQWGGRADVLLRVGTTSELGAWSYEVVDTKLAQETKGSTVLQLCLYSDLLATAQGLLPNLTHVVRPEPGYVLQSYCLADYAAYYRRVRWRLEDVVQAETLPDAYPDPNPHCDVCRCRDDHRASGSATGPQRVSWNSDSDTWRCSLSQMPCPTSANAPTHQRVRSSVRFNRVMRFGEKWPKRERI